MAAVPQQVEQRASDRASHQDLALLLVPETEFQVIWPTGCPDNLAVDGATYEITGETSTKTDGMLLDQPPKEFQDALQSVAYCVESNVNAAADISSLSDNTNGASQGHALVWPHEAIVAMIAACESRKHLFHEPGVRKMEVWKQIADELLTKGFAFSWEACEKKMNNLKYRYKLIRRNGNRYHKGARPWAYFKAIKSIVDSDQKHIMESIPVGGGGAGTEAPLIWQEAGYGTWDGVANAGDDKMTLARDSQNNNSDVDDDNMNAFWTHDLIMMLIRACQERQHLFRAPNIRKKDLWKQIAAEMQTMGASFSWEACEKKMRNLKYRYQLNLKTADGDGKKKRLTHWRYFDAIHGLVSGTAPAEQNPATVMAAPGSLLVTDTNQTVVGLERTMPCSSVLPILPEMRVFPRVLKPSPVTTSPRFKKMKFILPAGSAPSPSAALPPPWFREFAAEQKRCLDEILRLSAESLKVAKERNSILQTLTAALIRRDCVADNQRE